MLVDGVGEQLRSVDNGDDGKIPPGEDGQSKQEQNRATRNPFGKRGKKMVYAKKIPAKPGYFIDINVNKCYQKTNSLSDTRT